MLEYEMLPSPAKHPIKRGFSQIVCLGQIRSKTLGKSTNVNLTLSKLTWVYLPKINLPNVFYPVRLSRVTLPTLTLGNFTNGNLTLVKFTQV